MTDPSLHTAFLIIDLIFAAFAIAVSLAVICKGPIFPSHFIADIHTLPTSNHPRKESPLLQE